MAQTAVEWLEKEFVKLEVTIGVHGVMYEIIEQAKEMEKENLQDSFIAGGRSRNDFSTGKVFQTYEQYYNETFKKD